MWLRAQQPPLNASSRPDAALRLSPGDLIELSVYNVPDLNTKVRIGSNGDVYLPLIDYVHLGGLTAEEAQSLIQKRLSDEGFLKDPHVSVLVDEYSSGGISVLGEVAKPGVYPVRGQQHLFDLISAAGGLTEKAGRSLSVAHRGSDSPLVTVPLSRNLADQPESNVQVYAGDTIIVSNADVVYVVGDVRRASAFFLDGGQLTVLQAIALAGGTTRTAKLSAARVIRKGPSGMTEMPVRLKQILEAKTPDMPMQANDILFIPTSAEKVFMGRTVDAAMQAVTAASIVAVHP